MTRMKPVESSIIALIPAAGRSRRMGTSKLLLPTGTGRFVIQDLLASLRGHVQATFVLVRPDDVRLHEVLAGEAQVEMVCPDFESQDMRQSVELLVEAIEASDLAASIRGCLMTPADHPVIHPDTLQQLLAGFEADRYAIHLPVHEGRRGHPVLLPWQLARQVRNLPEGTGVNALRALPGVQTIEHQVRHPSILWDLDTPADYQAFLAITGANEE